MYSCLIIGLGNIGMGYDFYSSSIQSHAKAINFHKKFILSGAVEIDKKKRSLFEKKYQKPSFRNIGLALKLIKPEIIIISSPTTSHFRFLKKILSNHKPKAIVCEKPLGNSLKQSLKIIKICKRNKIQIYVNYLRLSDPGVIKIKEKLSSGKIKTPISGTIYYSKGALNNASHFLNTLEYWFGKVNKSQLIDRGIRLNKFDFNSSFIVCFKKANFIFIPTEDNKNYTNSIEIFANNGRLFYGNGGRYINWQKIISNNYNLPKFHKKIYKQHSGKKRSQLHFINNLYYALKRKNCNICTGNQAIKTLKTIYSLYDK